MSREEWRNIIPRPYLDGLAGTRALGRSTQVLLALLSKMFADQANSGSETPEATVTLASLVQLTGRGRREVQKSIEILYRAGVLIDVEASPGRAKVLRLNPGPKGARVPAPESGVAQSGRGYQKGRGSRPTSGAGLGPHRARVPAPESGHTHKEQVLKNLLEELPRGTLDFAEVEAAPSLNGHVKHVEKGDDRRQERKATVHEIADVLRKNGGGMTSGEIAQALQANPVSVASSLGHNDSVFFRSGYDRQRDQNIYALREWERTR